MTQVSTHGMIGHKEGDEIIVSYASGRMRCKERSSSACVTLELNVESARSGYRAKAQWMAVDVHLRGIGIRLT